MKTKTHNPVLDLPPSCKSAQERMAAEIEREDLEAAEEERARCRCTYQVAELNNACQEKISQFEHELNKQGYWNIALVAYQKDC